MGCSAGCVRLLAGRTGQIAVAIAPPITRMDMLDVIEPTPIVRWHRQPTRKEIEEAAYYIWLREGKPEGQSHRHWLDAERRLKEA